MVCEKLFGKIEELFPAYVPIWEQLGNIESPSSYKPGVDAVGDLFAQMAEARGWKVERFAQEVSGDVICITLNPDAPGKPVSLSGHMDTVHPLGLFGQPPVHRDAEKIYGPGITDCKGGILAGFLAMDALQQCGFTKRPVQLLLQSDEEVSSMPSGKATIGYICEKAKNSIAFLNLESHTKHKTTLVRKGIASYRFTVTGIEGHSARRVTEGANAVVDAAYKIIELDKFRDDAGITCNCAIVNGGSALNTIAGKCVFSVNFRFATGEQQTQIEEYVQNLAGTTHVPGCTCTVEKVSYRSAMEPAQRNYELLEKANAIFADNGLPQLEATVLRSGSDAADVASTGVPCLDSFGTTGGKTHSAGEFAWLNSLAESAKRIAAVTYCIE